jgi:cobalt-zinc-cadmium efflux system outer membrane protein
MRKLWLCFVFLAPVQGALRLEDLIREALEHNPDVAAALYRYQASRYRPGQASSLPETVLSAGYTGSGRPWPGAGLGVYPTSNIGVMVAQEFPFPGKRRLRGQIAEVESNADYQRYQEACLAVISRLKQAYYRLVFTYLAEESLQRNRELLQLLLKISEARYAVGKTAQQDVLRAQTQLALLDARFLQLERERRARQAEILGLVNRKPGEPVEKPEMPRPQPLAFPLEELLAKAAARAPALLRDEKQVARNQLAVNLARKDYYPDYAISSGYYTMGRMPDMFEFRVDFRLPTSFFRRQRAALAEQSRQLAESRKTLAATAQDLAYRIQEEYLAATTAYRLMELYEESVVPQSNLTLESSLASYQTGAVDFLTVFSNFSMTLEYELNYYEEMTAHYQALARLEALTGGLEP